MKPEIKILLIDDDEDDFVLARDVISEIKPARIKLDWAHAYHDAKKLICEDRHDLYLIDYRLGEHSGLDLLNEVVALGCRKPIIILTGLGDEGIDMAALKAGAADYLVKGKLEPYLLDKAIRYSIERNSVIADLYDKEQRFRVLFEKSIDAIYITSTEDKFIEVNQSVLDMFGYTRQEMAEREVFDLFDSFAEYESFKNTLGEKGVIRGFEVTLLNKKEEKIHCLISQVALVDYSGKIKGYQGIIHDITQRKKAEQELLWAEKLGMTGRMARSIAHEVRNPLTNVILALDQFKSELPQNEQVDFYTDIINRNCDRINQLLTQLLESAKPTDLKLEPASLNEVLDETIKHAEDRLKLRGMSLIKNYQDNLPLIPVDKEKLKIAFLNIIINAIEAMSDGEGILKINTLGEKEIAQVEIEDNGSGIPKEHLNKLFDAFFTGKRNGIGLGLTSTHNIISTHKGNIDIKSEVGAGTKFIISFGKIKNQKLKMQDSEEAVS